MSNNDLDLLKGINEIINPQNARSGLDYEKIEAALSSNGSLPAAKNPTEEFKRELNDLAKDLGFNFEQTPGSAARLTGAEVYARGTPRRLPSASRVPTDSFGGGSARSAPLSNMSSILAPGAPELSEASFADANFLADLGMPPSLAQSQRISSPARMSPNRPSLFRDNDGMSEFDMRTREQHRHDQVKNVIDSMGGNASNFISLEEANKEDEKIIMLDEIDSLRSGLEEEDARGLDKIPIVTQNDSYSTVENVLTRLRLKNDRTRYTGLADEFLLWGAQGLEGLFDGKRKWFGKNPDLGGWSKEVQVKLRRIKHDTSTLVSGVMRDYNIGPAFRIILELVPNMFMYARRRKQNYGKSNLYSDKDIANHISAIRNIDNDDTD